MHEIMNEVICWRNTKFSHTVRRIDKKSERKTSPFLPGHIRSFCFQDTVINNTICSSIDTYFVFGFRGEKRCCHFIIFCCCYGTTTYHIQYFPFSKQSPFVLLLSLFLFLAVYISGPDSVISFCNGLCAIAAIAAWSLFKGSLSDENSPFPSSRSSSSSLVHSLRRILSCYIFRLSCPFLNVCGTKKKKRPRDLLFKQL